MKGFRYLPNVSTLKLDPAVCMGCGVCATVCPHRCFEISDHKARIVDQDACMECGACLRNCPVQAIALRPGVGCASYIIKAWIKGKKSASCGSSDCAC
jgi:NAD-dependent dihydropyrimidine dehydrogenase PreA subunit